VKYGVTLVPIAAIPQEKETKKSPASKGHLAVRRQHESMTAAVARGRR
jgi:hypothetical protein